MGLDISTDGVVLVDLLDAEVAEITCVGVRVLLSMALFFIWVSKHGIVHFELLGLREEVGAAAAVLR